MNICVYAQLASTFVLLPGPPRVMMKMMSNTLNELIKVKITTMFRVL